jgi:hypothetical protein
VLLTHCTSRRSRSALISMQMLIWKPFRIRNIDECRLFRKRNKKQPGLLLTVALPEQP